MFCILKGHNQERKKKDFHPESCLGGKGGGEKKHSIIGHCLRLVKTPMPEFWSTGEK